MKFAKSLLAAALAAGVLTACVADGATRPPAAAVAAPRPAWTHEVSDLAPDPAVRFGVLPNGMRYALMRNATPPGQASIRLHFAVGSLMEAEDQRGLAHFLEHMAFNGSRNVPEGEMIRRLERHGLQFGPDTNASTSFDQTIYMLDVPRADAESLETALFLMREAAGELLLDEAAIDRERGIILSEERTRDTPGLRVTRALFDFLMPGQLPPRRFPIGDTEVIRTAPRERFVDLYDRYYRPDRATLVIVGDVDLDAMEADVRRRFGDWTARASDGGDPDLGPLAERGRETRVVVEPGGAPQVSLTWLRPYRERPDTRAERQERLVRALGFAVLNRRFDRIARGADAPFIAAGASRSDLLKSAEVVSASASARPGRHADALAAVEREVRAAVEFGITRAELDREIADLRSAYAASVAGAATRRTPQLASALVSSAHNDTVFTHPAENLALLDALAADLTPERVSAALRAEFAGSGPLIFAASPTPIEGGEAALTAAFDASRRTPVAAPVEEAARAWPYTAFGAPGRVVEREVLADLETTFVRFDNGVRLTVKPTAFRDDQILVQVRAGSGRLAQPRRAPNAAWAASAVFTEGGLKALTAEEMERVLAGRRWGASLGVADDAVVLTGGTRPEDFALQLQVLAAYATEPGWRPEPFERLRARGPTLHDQLESTPGGVFGRDAARLIRSGDPRWGTPSREEIASARLEDLRRFVDAALADGPFEVIVVGDVTVEEAIARTAETFGALSARPAARPIPAEARAVRFPGPTREPVRLTHKGRADQAYGWVGWSATDFVSDPQEARALRVLEQILRLRLTEELREAQAVTYSPQTGFEAAWEWPGYGYVSAAIEAPQDRLAGFFTDVAEIAAALRDKPVSEDELLRAVGPRVEQIQTARATNEYWLGQLGGAQTDPRRLTAVREAVSGLRAVDAAAVQAVARKYLRDDRAFRVLVVPEGGR